MASLRYIVPALAAISGAAAASASCSVSATTTIQSAADATALQSCSTFSGSIAIATGTADNIDLSGIKEITGSLYADSARNLPGISSTTLTSIDDTFHLGNLTVLSSLSFPALTMVKSIDWSGLPALQELVFTSQVSMASNLSITNTFLGSLQGINLETVDTVFIANNLYLTTITMPLGNISEALTISANGDALAASFPNLVWANYLSLNASTVSTPSLQTVNTSLLVSSDRLTGYQAPNLTTVGQDLAFRDCGMLTNISFPQLKTVNGGLTVNRTALSSINFPKLTYVGGAVDFEGNFSSASLPSISTVVGACNLASTSDISSTCNTFQNLAGGNSPVIHGQYQCQSTTSTLNSGPASSSGSSGAAQTSKTGAAVPLQIPAMTGVLAVLAAMFGLL